MISTRQSGSPATSTKIYQHRRTRLSVRQMMSYAGTYIANQFYYVGCMLERNNRRFRRRIVHGCKALFSLLWRGVSVAAVAAWKALCSVARDIAGPFKTALHYFANVSALKKEVADFEPEDKKEIMREYYRDGWQRNRTVVDRFTNIMLPAACLALTIVVGVYILNLEFGLRIDVDGQTIGYVYNENDFNSAERIIENRMVAVDDDIWNSGATYSVAIVQPEEIVAQDALADALLRASGNEIVEATGLYVGGVFLGATTEGETLHTEIDSILQIYETAAAGLSNATVKFARDVELVDGIFPTASVSEYSYFENLLAAGVYSGDLVYKVKEGDTALEIAQLNGISLTELSAFNPGVNVDDLLSEGTELVVARNENLFAVKTLTVYSYTETISYSTVVVADSRYDVGYIRVLTSGQTGEKQITIEIEYEDGREVARTVESEVVTREAVNQQLVVGVRTSSGSATTAIGTGRLYYPVPTTGLAYLYVYRGFTEGVHYGVDLTCPNRTYIFAADNGIVTQACYYGDYGNFVQINHNNGMTTQYGHMSQILCSEGEVVERGQLIGLVGTTGRSTGYHLHFEVSLNGTRVDPEPWINGTIYY